MDQRHIDPEHMSIRRDDHFDQAGRGPVLNKQAAKDRLEVFAYFHSMQFEGAPFSDLVRLADDGIGHEVIQTHIKVGKIGFAPMNVRSQFSDQRS